MIFKCSFRLHVKWALSQVFGALATALLLVWMAVAYSSLYVTQGWDAGRILSLDATRVNPLSSISLKDGCLPHILPWKGIENLQYVMSCYLQPDPKDGWFINMG